MSLEKSVGLLEVAAEAAVPVVKEWLKTRIAVVQDEIRQAASFESGLAGQLKAQGESIVAHHAQVASAMANEAQAARRGSPESGQSPTPVAAAHQVDNSQQISR